MQTLRRALLMPGLLMLLVPFDMASGAGQSDEALAKAAQNPVANMIACRSRTTPVSTSVRMTSPGTS
ncbi:MAG TPA: hypothetical protein VET88_10645 [Gammaproteobacteria bacterium]|nr:hypothetical protein [Gammaproteobacteria bacterium]